VNRVDRSAPLTFPPAYAGGVTSCASVLPEAQGLRVHPEGARVGVLVIHGFTGSAASMRGWALALADAGHAVSMPRLAGHGTHWRELALTEWTDWYAGVEQAYDELASTVDTVFVAGLSMGGALALRLAERERVAGLMLVNPAIASDDKAFLALPVLKRVTASIKAIGNDIALPGQDEHAYPRTPLAAAHSMTRLWADVRGYLDQVTCPVLLMTSRVDHVVDPLSGSILEATLPDLRRVWLERSHHVATLDHDAALIIDESLTFVREHT